MIISVWNELHCMRAVYIPNNLRSIVNTNEGKKMDQKHGSFKSELMIDNLAWRQETLGVQPWKYYTYQI